MDYFIANKHYETTPILDDIYIWNWIWILGIEFDTRVLVEISTEEIFASIDSNVTIVIELVYYTNDWVSFVLQGD